MKKKFFTVMISLLVLMISTASAEPSKNLLNDMYANPKNYICIGGAGTGVLIFLSKSSVDVQKYIPPEYLIAIRWITFTTHGVKEDNGWKAIENARLGKMHRYLYDYTERKIYSEVTDSTNAISWQLLDITKANGPNSSLMSKEIEAAEYAFYFAYNMSFFDLPVSRRLKDYISHKRYYTFDEIK